MFCTRNHIICGILLSGWLLGGCSSTIHRKANIDGIETLSIDAKQRLVLVNRYGGPRGDKRIACAEPSPDALVAQAAAISGQLTTPEKIEAAFSASSSESAGALLRRTQSIQILRDGYFRLCETYMNGGINEHQYIGVVQNIDSVIMVVMAIDALSTTPAGPALEVSSGPATAAVNVDGPTTGTPPATVKIDKINVNQADLAASQASAIENIVREYLAHKRKLAKYQSSQERNRIYYK